MIKCILLSFVFFFPFNLLGQQAKIASFQHTVRWVSEANFPSYHTSEVQVQVLEAAGNAVKKRFGVLDVAIPFYIDYHYISGFGNAKIKKNSSATPSNYTISILSFLTRATASHAILWKMQVEVFKNNERVYEKRTEHELEYYNVSGYNSLKPWYNTDEFAAVFISLVNEVFEVGEVLPMKITVGSPTTRQDAAKSLFHNFKSYILKAEGDFLGGRNFVMSLQKGEDTLSMLHYMDGMESASSPLINLSEIGANVLKSLTGLTIGYNAKVRERRFGRILYSNGRKLKMKVEWIKEIETNTAATIERSWISEPVLMEIYEDKKLIASFVFIKSSPPINTKPFSDVFILEGMADKDNLRAEYLSNEDLITISRNEKKELELVLDNINPDSKSQSGVTLSKNKVLLSQGSQSLFKKRFKNPEWYSMYVDSSLEEKHVIENFEVVLYLLFGLGNQEE